MGAIAAVFRRDGAPVGEEAIRSLGAALRRRGPGGGGAWREGAVGLLGIGGGARVFEHPAAGLRLVFDGRLDGAEELRRGLAGDGFDPGGAADGALALRALAAFGPAAGAARLQGDFAFLLWDGRRRVLVAGRDPLGVRPLLLHDDGRRVAFATEAAALVDGAGVPLEPDEGVAAEVLAGGPWSRAATLVHGIRRVLPGTLVVVAEDRVAEVPFRGIDPDRVRLPRDPAGCVEAFRAVLGEAVRRRLEDEGPAALCLGGGLDSAAVAALAGGRARSFTVSYPGLPMDESALARETAAAAGSVHETIPWTPPGPHRFADEARRSRDLPDAPPSATLDGMADRIRAGGFAVVLDGEGGDEVFAPSPYLVADRLGAGAPLGAWREARGWGGGAAGALRILAGSGLRPFLPAPLRAGVRRLRPRARPPAWVGADLARRVGLADRMRRETPAARPGGFARAEVAGDLVGGYALWSRESLDRWGLRCGAEARHPFLDLDVVETALALPDNLRSSKEVLRRALEGLLPDAVRARRGKADFSPLAATAAAAPTSRLARAGWIDPGALAAAPLPARVAALALEAWLEAAETGDAGDAAISSSAVVAAAGIGG